MGKRISPDLRIRLFILHRKVLLFAREDNEESYVSLILEIWKDILS